MSIFPTPIAALGQHDTGGAAPILGTKVFLVIDENCFGILGYTLFLLLKIENKILTDSLVNVKLHFENLELELFQKVIDKKMEEQHFIDSVLTKFCTIDTVFLPADTFLVDSIRVDSMRIDSIITTSPILETE